MMIEHVKVREEVSKVSKISLAPFGGRVADPEKDLQL